MSTMNDDYIRVNAQLCYSNIFIQQNNVLEKISKKKEEMERLLKLIKNESLQNLRRQYDRIAANSERLRNEIAHLENVLQRSLETFSENIRNQQHEVKKIGHVIDQFVSEANGAKIATLEELSREKVKTCLKNNPCVEFPAYKSVVYESYETF